MNGCLHRVTHPVRETGWYGSDTYEARAEVGTNRGTTENKGTGFRAIFVRNFFSI
jgi:hypothetical protein